MTATGKGSVSLSPEKNENGEPLNPNGNAMTPEEQQQLDEHVQALAKILYANADRTRLTTLGDIEKQVREQLQAHVSPKLGSFLSATSLPRTKDTPAH